MSGEPLSFIPSAHPAREDKNPAADLGGIIFLSTPVPAVLYLFLELSLVCISLL